MSNTLSIIDNFRAENLLEGSLLLTQIEELRTSLRYTTGGAFISFEDHFANLQTEIDNIQRLVLMKRIGKEAAQLYTIELVDGLEQIQDNAERLQNKLVLFQGKLAEAQAVIKELSSTFEAWYTIAVAEYIKNTELKIPQTSIRSLATSEFNRLMGRANIGIDTLIEAVKIEVKRVEGKKKMAQKKFDLGKEQVNVAWANMLPGLLGHSPESGTFGVLQEATEDEDEGEGVPSFISQLAPLTQASTIPAEELKAITASNVPTAITLVAESVSESKSAAAHLCVECGGTQFDTPGGISCANGHGGADGIEVLSETESQPQPEYHIGVDYGVSHPETSFVVVDSETNTIVAEGTIPDRAAPIFKTGTPQPTTVIGEIDGDELDEILADLHKESTSNSHVELPGTAAEDEADEGEPEPTPIAVDDEEPPVQAASEPEPETEPTPVPEPTPVVAEPAGEVVPRPITKRKPLVFDYEEDIA